eukprot:CAMPEP_0206616894 /NCGR_PEP_ID=MMETSP0325_2-20121206/59275_1 /ASSEMBLY_ACC=CAM_ASM_000347 /TAXON_ID=2866 /ORGANISM="Crypthecodinium cohnii, Strain Seligo" /LENGTH=67 /DNA_ID=CAMNT_0054138701 /DNA_START=13 /DNA_END=213 /DNA_ORIENTATION=+
MQHKETQDTQDCRLPRKSPSLGREQQLTKIAKVVAQPGTTAIAWSQVVQVEKSLGTIFIKEGWMPPA